MPLSDKPVISVIMPAYNHEKYVEEAIMSVIDQNGIDYELIVINDGSTDKTPEIIEQLSKEYGFIYVSRPNKGLIPTIEEALKLAKGEYIAFLASDDAYLPNRLTSGVKSLQYQLDKKASYARALVMNQQGFVIARFEELNPAPIFKKSHRELLVMNWINAATVTYRGDFLRRIHMFDGLKIEDWYFLLLASKDGGLIYHENVCVKYRIHTTNQSFGLNSSLVSNQINIMSKKIPELGFFMKELEDVRGNPINLLRLKNIIQYDLFIRYFVRFILNKLFRRNLWY